VKLGVLLDRLGAAPGGAERHTVALLRRATQRGIDAAIALLEGEGPEGVETLRVRAPRARPERDEVFAREGERALRAAGCDVVLAIRHAPACDVYLPHGGLVDDARAAHDEAHGGPSLVTRVRRAFSRKHAWFEAAERAVLEGERGPLVIAVSQALADRIRARHPKAAARVAIVPNGVDETHFAREGFVAGRTALRRSLGLGDDALLLLLLAHDPILKGAETAVAALARPEVRDLGRPVHLALAGARAPRRLRRLARRLGAAARTHRLGALADPRPWYAAADLLVHPTWHDPCSLVCLEALSMGLPVITTPRNGVRELMGQRGGIVIEAPGDAGALAFAVRVLSDDALRAFTAEDARYVAQKNREATRLDRLLDLCAARGRGEA